MAGTGWPAAVLDGMRGNGDPVADATVAQIFQESDIATVASFLTSLIRSDDVPAPAAFAGLVRQYLQSTSTLPPWADQGMIRQGEDLFSRYGLAAFAVLAFASLPECYVLRSVARVLGRTGQLRDHAYRRIMETAQMVLAIMDRGGLAAGGQGVFVAQKVRLMHAAMRRLLLYPPPAQTGLPPGTFAEVLLAFQWESEWGCPINQEDLAAVLLTFSHVILRGWRELGIALSSAEENAYLHCWNVVGHLLGVQQELIPADPGNAGVLFETIKRRQEAGTEDGRLLTCALLDFCADLLPRPRSIFRRLVPLLMWQLLEDKTCQQLAIPAPTWIGRLGLKIVLLILRALGAWQQRFYRDFPGAGLFAGWFAYGMLEKLPQRPRGGDRSRFQLPDALASTWRLRAG